MGTGTKVELTFDPGDLGHVNVFDPRDGRYVRVPAVDQAYAKGLSLWQHKVVRRYAQRTLNARTDIVALAEAKAQIRALVERDFNRKSTHGRKRHARFLESHVAEATPTLEAVQVPAEPTGASPPKAWSDEFTDDEVLPAFEADFDLPQHDNGYAPGTQ